MTRTEGENSKVCDEISKLIDLSRYYGKKTDMIQGGGGNTSLKLGKRMWVKASGIELKEITDKRGFVEVALENVNRIFEDKGLLGMPESELDEEVGKRLLSAKVADVSERPSIETFLHALLKETFVVHSHPIYVNAMACACDGQKLAASVFEDSEYIWIPYKKPGYPLGQALYKAASGHVEKYGAAPNIVFLESHGLIISGNSVKSLHATTEKVIGRMFDYFGGYTEIQAPYKTHSMSGRISTDYSKSVTGLFGEQVELLWSKCPYINALAYNKDFMNTALKGALYPDHIVYCGQYPLVLEKNEKDTDNKIKTFVHSLGYLPRYIVVPEVGVIIAGKGKKDIAIKEEMLRTHVKTMTLILHKNKPLFLADEECKYLSCWEAEKYRQNLAGMNN